MLFKTISRRFERVDRRLLIAGLLIAVFLATVLPIARIASVNADSSKTVYVVICIDSEGPVDLHRNPGGWVAPVFDSGFRNSHVDSFGTPFKMTWYSHMSALIAYGSNGPDGPLLTYTYSDGTPAGVSGCLALRDILHNNWGPEMALYGDEDGYHHHFMIWTGTGPYAGWDEYDQGPDDPSYTDHMDTIDHMILDDGFFPSSWRTGWLVQTSGLSNWLEQWIPFDYTPSYGDYYPWNPPGMSRWQTRCDSESASQDGVNEAFARARDNGVALYSFYCHEREDMASNIDALQTYLNNADADETDFPGVSFKYVSAKEAMQRNLGYTDFTPPTFTVTPSSGTYTVASNEPLWANHPYVALKYANGQYMHIAATPAGTNTWTVTPPTQFVTDENVALRARGAKINIVGATAEVDSPGYEAWRAIDGVDGDYNSYWGGTCPAWLQLDLGSVTTFSQIKTHFYDGDGRYYTYYIEVSDGGSTWTPVTSSRSVHGMAVDDFSSGLTARYIRIWVTYNTENPWCHIMEVYVSSASTITASAGEPDLAIDGVESTSNYWQAWPAPAWIQLDLRSSVPFSKITTHFYDGDSRYYYYYIEVSNDASTWTTVVPQKTGSGSVTDTFPEVSAQYVRITVPYPGNSVNVGVHIEEIKVYHETTTQLPPLDKIGVGACDVYGNPSVLVQSAAGPVITNLYIDPQLTEKTSIDVGSNFWVNVAVTDVTDLQGFDFKVTWDSTLLTLASVDFTSTLNSMWGIDNWYELVSDVGVGYYKLVAVSTAGSFTGPGPTVLARLEFHVEDPHTNVPRETLIHFGTHKLSDSEYNPITHTVSDGTYRITGGQPSLQLSPTSKTCRKYGETFPVAVTVSNEYDVTDFEFEIHYDTTLLDYSSATWTVWGSGTIIVDEVNGIITGSTSGSGISGVQTLVAVQFTAAYHHIWKDETKIAGWENDQSGLIFFQSASLSYAGSSALSYVRGGGNNQISVGADVVYTFSPIRGDVDNGGSVDVFDLRTVAAYYDQPNTTYDLNGDNFIDIFDLVIIASNYGFTYP